MAETTTSKPSAPVTISNPEQASSNFYWTYETTGGVFNLQTTVRGILTLDQIKAHIKSELEAIAHVVSLGGQAKQVGRNAVDQQPPASPLPEPTPADEIIAEVMANDPLWNTGGNEVIVSTVIPEQAGQVATSAPQPDIFQTEKLICTITNNKKYFKVKGGNWMKYGIVVWDEVLIAAGINVANLEGKEYNLQGYRATFIRREDGKPEKVVKLEKVSQG